MTVGEGGRGGLTRPTHVGEGGGREGGREGGGVGLGRGKGGLLMLGPLGPPSPFSTRLVG